MTKGKLPFLWISLALTFFASSATAQQDSLDMWKLGQLGYTQTLNDVWGWVDTASNKEYALVGVQNGLSVVDVSTPSNPVQTNFFPGASSVWRDIKTYGNYSYTVHDNYNGTSQGIFIVDMTTLGATFPTTYTRKPTINVAGTDFVLDRAHNIYIDEVIGHLYLFGADVGNGGALIFDLNPDPTNPVYLGIFNDYYLHDGVARGDTIWGAAILDGFFIPIDVSNPSNPVFPSTQSTPFNFTHNIWFSDDNQRVFTTDEKTGAYIAEYDVSNLTNISESDRIRTHFGTDVIPHNAHFHNNFLVNSYYTSGVQIVDVTKPGQMVETGYFDTSPDSGDGFSGCWGAYPYLPSGIILATDRQQGLFVLGSDYSRATYLQVTVIDSVTGQSLINARVNVRSTAMNGNTNIFGNYSDGQASAGSYTMVVSKGGYRSDSVTINLSHGNTLNQQVALLPMSFSVQAYGPLLNVEPYPNPISSEQAKLVLSNWTDDLIGGQFQVIELNGRLIQSGILTGKELDFNELSLAAGTYILQLKSENFARSYPLMVQ